MSDKFLQDDLINLVGIRNEELKNEAALYIMDKYPKIFKEFEIARKVADILIHEHNAKIENFRLGQMDHQIRKYAEYEKMRQQSKKNEKNEDIKLKIKKKHIAKNVMIGLVIGAVATTGIIYSAKNSRRNLSDALKEEGQVVYPTDEPFIGNPNYESQTNIVKDNTVVAGVTESGNQVYSHKYDQIAAAILEYYNAEPEKLDFYLCDVSNSFNPVTNLKDMDMVFFELVKLTNNKEEYKDLKTISDSKIFVRYLLTKLDYDDPNYDDILISITNYENNRVGDKENYYLDYLEDNYNNSIGFGGRN